MERPDKINYYLDIAETVSKRSTCLRKHYGAIIVKNDIIISTGYNGAPRGRKNCCDLKFCMREKMNIPRGERYELCKSVHAEQNAVIFAGFDKTNGATLYLAGVDAKTNEPIDAPDCCMMCKRVLINAGIKNVKFLNGNGTMREIKVQTWVNEED